MLEILTRLSIALTAMLWVVCGCFLEAGTPSSAQIRYMQTNFRQYLLDFTEQDIKQGKRAMRSLALNSTVIFSQYPDLTQVKQLYGSLKGLADLAKLYANPQSPHYRDISLKTSILEGLKIFARYYAVEGMEVGNWWPWEIGIPKTLNEILVIMGDSIPPPLQTTLLQAQAYYQPDPRYSGLSVGARSSTNPRARESQGANRVDTAFIGLIRGVVQQDPNQILAAIKAVKSASTIVHAGNGFYADGSFIQHEHVPSNGSYGIVLLKGLAQFMVVLEHTPFSQNLIDPGLYASVLKSYPYFLIQGGLNASVCGRSISRDRENDFSRAKGLIEALAILSEHAPSPYRNLLQNLIAQNLKSQPNLINTSHTISQKILARIAAINFPPLSLKPVQIFGAMDRAAQRGTRGGQIVLALHSNRILNYETMNGENLKGFDSSDGMSYIYGDANAFIDFWPLVNPTKLPGTTELKGQEEVLQRRGNLGLQSWAGGASNRIYGFVGMDLQKTGFRAQKSYLLMGNAMVALGSVQSPKPTITAMDNRKISPQNAIYTNAQILQQSASLTKKGDTLNFSNPIKHSNIGYVLLQDMQVSVDKVSRQGSYADIGGRSTRTLEAPFLEAIIHHPPKQASYAYLVLPQFSPQEVQNYPLEDIEIIAQNPKVHALRLISKNLLAINKYQSGWLKIGDLQFKEPLSILEIKTQHHLQLSIADPTQQLTNPITLILEGRYSLANSKSSAQLTYKGKHTYLSLQTLPLGASLVVELVKTP
ncbi:polysaccharide lyase family 8 super-sandwich domain-containing protein [Helicobacter salomonis]|uniref:polysaccharide lyase family 8 super-sandwich domain-containing protein n=1 Tax=Helicobacter salomonis TaxID=56878 RepID=UPI001F23B1E0|nr:polysaccharide lyase family 8 super-sandwich domain-containing protein [Helicobacter salomonis]